MPVFDPEATARVDREARGAAIDQFRTRLPEAIRIDAASGRVDLAADTLERLTTAIVPGAGGVALTQSLIGYAGSGFVSLGGRSRDPVLIPWLAMEDLAFILGGCPGDVRTALGVEAGMDGARISENLHTRYRSLPADIFGPGAASLLSHGPTWLAGNPIDPPDPPDPPTGTHPPPSRQRPPGTVTAHAASGVLGNVAPSTAPDVAQLAECLLKGTWGPWWSDPPFNTGWAFGFRVCLDHECADRLATYLLRFFAPSPLTLGSALLSELMALGTSAGMQSLCSTFSFWLALATFEIGMNLAFANEGNGNRGVCVYCSWPWVGIPVFALSR